MKKQLKSLLFAALVTLVLTLSLAMAASATEAEPGTFYSTEGTLNCVYLANGGTLAATGNTYEEKTLVIYGDGTSYSYAGTITSGTTATEYLPWGSNRSNIYHIAIEAPNLTSFVCFRQMGNVKTIVMPASINILDTNALYGLTKLESIKIADVDYSDYGENVYDLRNIVTLKNTAFYNVAKDITKDIKILFGENTSNDSEKQNFCNGSASTFTIYCEKNTAGETFANTIKTLSAGSSTIASSITVENYPEPEAPAELSKALFFDGFQVRTKVMPTADGTGTAVNGLRTLFSCNEAVVNEGYTLTEYGTIIGTKENTEIYTADLNNEAETKYEKIVKVPVYRNGIYGYLLPSDDENNIRFATTLININEEFYSTELCIRGYEVWKNNTTNELNIVYSDILNADETIYYPSLSDVMINNFATGLINSADEDENHILWNVLDTCRVELTSSSDTYVVSDNVISPADTTIDTSVHVFKKSDETYVAIVTGTGATGRIGAILDACSIKAATVVIDDGFDELGFASFKKYYYVKTVIYPDSIKKTGTECFNNASALVSVSKVKTEITPGTIDLHHLNNVGFNYLFSGAKAAIQYIHLPKIQGEIEVTIAKEAFKNISTLKAVWCGDNEMIEGTANFTGTSVTGEDGTAFTGCTGITSFNWGTAPQTDAAE